MCEVGEEVLLQGGVCKEKVSEDGGEEQCEGQLRSGRRNAGREDGRVAGREDGRNTALSQDDGRAAGRWARIP